MRDNNCWFGSLKLLRESWIEVCELALAPHLLGTWLIQARANSKDVQGQMRHSRIATTTRSAMELAGLFRLGSEMVQ